MKNKTLPFLFLLLIWAGTVTGQILALSPEEMVKQAQFILAGQVVELRTQQEHPEFVILVDTVYRGELGGARLTVPLPTQSDRLWKTPELNSRMLFFFTINEQRRLAPAGSLNWAAFLKNGQVERLFMGARFNHWEEAAYIQEYNRFLAETPGIKIPTNDAKGETAVPEPSRRPGEVNPLWFFSFASIMFILLLVSAQLKKRRK